MCAQKVRSGAKWHEKKVFDYLESRLPKDYIFLKNRRLKGKHAFREFDLILLGKYAIYIVEIKHVMGKVIRGNNENWNWDSYVDKSGIYEIDSPLKQVWQQELLLEQKIAERGLKVALVECVCIFRDEKPDVQIQDAPDNLAKIFWYKDLEPFLTQVQQIPERLRRKYKIDETTDITGYHKQIKDLIDTNFALRVLDDIGPYEIENEAWRTARYTAYYVHSLEKAGAANRVLLKLYENPFPVAKQSNAAAAKKEINDFVTKLNGRANKASSKMSRDGDPATGGAKYILAGQKAFLTKNTAYAVVSEWIEGQPLSYFLKNQPSSKHLCTIAAQICRGLAYIHSAKVFHRNLSTDNIIWSLSDREIRIINFHFARLIGKKTILWDKHVIDSFIDEISTMRRYQAPELQDTNPLQQIQTEKLYHNANEATDIYSLGVVLLELFGGVFADTDTVEGRLKEMGHLSSDIKTIVNTYCNRKPEERIKINLVYAAQTFEKLAGNVMPDQDLFNLKAGTSLGFYEIMETLETTDLSVIYLAKYVLAPDDQKVVIKVHKTTSRGTTIRKELWDAIQLIGDIDNQFTARLLQTEKAYVSDGKVMLQPVEGAQEAYYQIWEYIQGKDLDAYLDSLRPYSLEASSRDQLQERFTIALGVLKALSALHEKKWTHRDIKPKNFMRTPDGQIKIIDFGLSRRSGDAKIVLGGTPCYIPPEAYSDNEWAEPGDVWAVGCLITYILTGEEICAADDADQEIEKIQGITGKLGTQIIQVLGGAVQNLPRDRYPSAVEFSTFFEEAYHVWQDGEDRAMRSENRRREILQEGGNTNMEYKYILAQLIGKRDEAKEFGDVAASDAIDADIRVIEKWLAGGQKGDCPVDLKIYGLGPTAASSGEVNAPKLSDDTKALVEQTPVENFDAEEMLVEESFESPAGMDMDIIAGVEVDHLQESLRQELDKVRALIETGQWREVVALGEQVERRASGEVKENISILLSQAKVQLSKELGEALAMGDAARTDNNAQKAREHYQAALDLDPSNSHARLALKELDGLLQEKVSGELLNAMRAGLNDRRDIHRLGEAVYDAEALDGEGKLPPKLVTLLKDAREYYDNTRREQGEETTAMRFGDVATRADAVARIQSRVARGTRTIYDQTTDTDRPAFDVLREAQELLRQASEDTAQHEINIAEKFKALRPRYVHKRLMEALGKPLQEQEKHKLEERLAEIDQYIQTQERAESLQSQAMQETDPVRKLGILLQASQTFNAVPGLEEQIVQTRPIAISVLQTGISDRLRRAELFIRGQEYSEARDATNEAEAEVAKWPERQRPEEIANLLSEARTLRERIDEAQNAWKEYTLLASDIRQKVVDQNQRAAGLALFRQVSENERFKEFPDLRVLTSEIDQYKGVGEQLNDAISARDSGDWSRVFEITDKVLKAGTAGQFSTRFQELHADAVTELNIIRAQELLASDEIPEANNILSATLNKERERSPERENILRSRLSDELERVQQAIRGNKPMQSLYDRACDLLNLRDSVTFKAFTSPSFALRQSKVGADGEVNSPEMRALINQLKDSPKEADPSPGELTERVARILLIELGRKGITERLNALRLFRYIGGDQTQSAQEAWPLYSLSLRTAEARRAARLLTDSLRGGVFEPLVQQYREFQGKESELEDESLWMMAEQAAGLREAYLLETESERAVGRWVEVEWGKRLAQEEERHSNWFKAVEVWKQLDTHYPGVTHVKRGLRNARIRYTIDRAHYLVHNDHKGDAAKTLLRDLQSESDMSNSWELHVALADTYEALSEFDAALGNLDQARRVIGGLDSAQQEIIQAQLQQKRIQLEDRRIIYTLSEDAKNKVTAGNPAEALRVLQNAIDQLRIKDTSPLQALRDQIFADASQKLLQKAQEEQNKGSDEGKILAVTSLVDLQTLEEIIGQSPEERRSTDGLDRLRADLAAVANAVISAANEFDPASMSLPQAISYASSLSARLQTFDNVIPLFNAELEPVRDKLTRRRRETAAELEKLRSLEMILQAASNHSLWESAIHTGDFQTLNHYLARITRLEFNNMQEVRIFAGRLSETEEIYNHLLDIIGQVRQKFSVEEDFDFVKRVIIESEIQPPIRESNQAWQAVHAREYEDICRLIDDHLRVADVYGRGDLVGWQKVLAQADERDRELRTWQDWHIRCERGMDIAGKAMEATEVHPTDLPTRVKKTDWEKVRDAAQAVIASLTYTQDEKFTDPRDGEEKQRTVVVVGGRDEHDVPLLARSRAAKDIEEEGKRRRKIAEDYLHRAEIQIQALDDILERRGFPSLEEFNSATSQSDWDRLEKLLARAREAGVTSEHEMKLVNTFANVLAQKRQEAQKKRFRLW